MSKKEVFPNNCGPIALYEVFSRCGVNISLSFMEEFCMIKNELVHGKKGRYEQVDVMCLAGICGIVGKDIYYVEVDRDTKRVTRGTVLGNDKKGSVLLKDYCIFLSSGDTGGHYIACKKSRVDGIKDNDLYNLCVSNYWVQHLSITYDHRHNKDPYLHMDYFGDNEHFDDNQKTANYYKKFGDSDLQLALSLSLSEEKNKTKTKDKTKKDKTKKDKDLYNKFQGQDEMDDDTFSMALKSGVFNDTNSKKSSSHDIKKIMSFGFTRDSSEKFDASDNQKDKSFKSSPILVDKPKVLRLKNDPKILGMYASLKPGETDEITFDGKFYYRRIKDSFGIAISGTFVHPDHIA